MNNDTTLETVNEDLVFSKPIADNKVGVVVNETSILNARADPDSSDIRTDAADSVVSFVDTSNASISVVDLSNSSSSIIDSSNSFIPIPTTDISQNLPVKPVGKETIKFSEPSTVELIENRDQKTTGSDTAVSKIGDVVEDLAEDLLNSVLDKVKESLGDLGVKPSTLPKIIQFVMEAIEDTPTKGPAQKDFALKVIGALIDELHESDEKKLLQETFKSGGIEGTIDLVVSATKGELNINQVVDVAVNSCICPFFNFSMSKYKSCINKSDVKNSVKV
jgi:hypothetical protein|tara:strand:- start:854 stop:1684 length:831 start_codon:yes stop_codon:yes gene_type:complete